MDNPKVSIIIATYNYARYLPMAIDSVLKQTFQDFQLIIVNDGSTDDTDGMIRPYLENPKVRYVVQKNQGQAVAFNNGIAQSTGELIAFLDADDIWMPNKLEKQITCLEKNPNIDFCYTNSFYMDYCGKIYGTPMIKNHIESHSPDQIMLENDILTPSAVMMRRSLLKAVGPFRNGMVCSDHDMWVRCAEIGGRMEFLSEALMAYRNHTSQINRSYKNWKDRLELFHLAAMRYPYDLSTRRRFMAKIYYRIGLTMKNNGGFFLHYWLFSGLLDPIKAFGKIRGIPKQ